jgi:hypothetical protein
VISTLPSGRTAIPHGYSRVARRSILIFPALDEAVLGGGGGFAGAWAPIDVEIASSGIRSVDEQGL